MFIDPLRGDPALRQEGHVNAVAKRSRPTSGGKRVQTAEPLRDSHVWKLLVPLHTPLVGISVLLMENRIPDMVLSRIDDRACLLTVSDAPCD